MATDPLGAGGQALGGADPGRRASAEPLGEALGLGLDVLAVAASRGRAAPAGPASSLRTARPAASRARPWPRRPARRPPGRAPRTAATSARTSRDRVAGARASRRRMLDTDRARRRRGRRSTATQVGGLDRGGRGCRTPAAPGSGRAPRARRGRAGGGPAAPGAAREVGLGRRRAGARSAASGALSVVEARAQGGELGLEPRRAGPQRRQPGLERADAVGVALHLAGEHALAVALALQALLGALEALVNGGLLVGRRARWPPPRRRGRPSTRPTTPTREARSEPRARPGRGEPAALSGSTATRCGYGSVERASSGRISKWQVRGAVAGVAGVADRADHLAGGDAWCPPSTRRRSAHVGVVVLHAVGAPAATRRCRRGRSPRARGADGGVATATSGVLRSAMMSMPSWRPWWRGAPKSSV